MECSRRGRKLFFDCGTFGEFRRVDMSELIGTFVNFGTLVCLIDALLDSSKMYSALLNFVSEKICRGDALVFAKNL